MASSKRVHEDNHYDQSTVEGAGHKTKKPREDHQNIDGLLDTPVANDGYQITVYLVSESKAAVNDAKSTRSQSEIYVKRSSFSKSSEVAPENQNTVVADLAEIELDSFLFRIAQVAASKKGLENVNIRESPSANTSRAERKTSSDNMYINKDDENEEDSPDDDDFIIEWLEEFKVEVTSLSILDEHGKPVVFACCHAKLIRRNNIREDFYEAMGQLSRQTAMLAFDLFDLHGRLRIEFRIHTVIKGTGIWGRELDCGDILLIEEMFVQHPYRRQRVGQQMMDALLTAIQQKTQYFFTLVRPDLLIAGDIKRELDTLQDEAAIEIVKDRETKRAVSFFRSLGFRRVGFTKWFAMTLSEDHRSKKLAATEDFNPRKPPSSALHPDLRPFELISDAYSRAINPVSSQQAQTQVPNPVPDFLGVLYACLEEHGSSDACWTSRDRYGNTILHLAALNSNLVCVEWILAQDFGIHLLQSPNYRGETPAEFIVLTLENARTLKATDTFTASVSHQFMGYDEGVIRCLALMKGAGYIQGVTLQRMMGGCTCGYCLDGFLSPRMLEILCNAASNGYDALSCELDELTGLEWVESLGDSLRYLPAKVRSELSINKSMRRGFTKLWDHVATCMEKERVPNEHNVLETIRDAPEWPPNTASFLQRGGAVEPVFLAICRQAMEWMEWPENERYLGPVDPVTAKLPECRNDREFGYVSGACGYRRIRWLELADESGNTLDEDGNIFD